MYAGNQEPAELMEIDVGQAEMASSQEEPETLLTFSLQWSENDQLPKMKMQLQKVLQTWFNKNQLKDGIKVDCSVKDILKDGTAVVKMDPAPALRDFSKLIGTKLTTKEGTNLATILSVSMGPPNLNKQPPDDVSVNLPPSSSDKPVVNLTSIPDKPADKGQFEEQSDSGSAAGQASVDDTKPSEERIVAVSLFCYLNNTYKEEIQRIHKQNKVKMISHVVVKFEAEQEDGTPAEALSEFTDLTQKCLPESNGSVVPLKYVDPDQWRDALRIVKNENKLLVMMTPEEMTVYGPRQIQDAFSQTINAMQTRNAPPEEDDFRFRSPTLKIDMTIKDNLTDTGLTMKEDQWKKMRYLDEKFETIKSKFNVDFIESSNSQGEVNVKAVYNGRAGNAAMESHAVRALLHLYQKNLTSLLCLTQPHGATGFNISHNFSKEYLSGDASNGPELNGNSTQQDNKPPSGEDSKEEQCPICLDSFINKKQLKCKHEFCEDCLEETKKHNGPICPICKDVFGVIEGDQPDGTMTLHRNKYSLPGFSGCGHIVITYNIPSGMQMEKHPKPGHYYSGITRTAYLPDNKEGKEVLTLLQKAFDRRLIFTIGTSRTTGLDNQVTWNDIHHKTSPTGGPDCFGYPDPNYLSRVKDELKAKGIE